MDSSTGPVASYDVEAEKEIIGAVLYAQEEAYHAAATVLQSRDFHAIQHRSIWDAFTALISKGIPVDPSSTLSVMADFGTAGHLKQHGGKAYLENLRTFAYTPKAVTFYAQRIVECAQRRLLLEAAAAIRAGQQMQPFNHAAYLNDVETLLQVALERRSMADSEVDGTEWAAEIREDAQRRAASKGVPIGVLSGCQQLDDVTQGFQPQELYVLAARPSVGKTAFSLNLAMGAALKGAAVFFFSLEMGRGALGHRVLAADAKIAHTLIKKGDLDGASLVRMEQALNRIAQSMIRVNDAAGLTVADIRSRAMAWLRRDGIKEAKHRIIFIDYLGKIGEGHRDRNRSTADHIGEMVSELKNTAKMLNLPIVLLCQINREAMKQNRKPTLTDLKDSGKIEDHADFVGFLHRDDYCKRDEDGRPVAIVGPRPAELIVEKNRNGMVTTINLRWDPVIQRFEDAR